MAGLDTAFSTVTAPLTGAETVRADTNLASGVTPQTEIFAVSALKDFIIGGNIANPSTRTATAAAAAATLNSGYGVITSEALVTAAGAFYSLTLTNSAIAATDIVLVTVNHGTNTTQGLAVGKVAPAAGSVVIDIKNTNAGALNGTIKIGFVVVKG